MFLMRFSVLGYSTFSPGRKGCIPVYSLPERNIQDVRVSEFAKREGKLVDMTSVVLMNLHLSQASVKIGPKNLRAGKGPVMWFYPSCLEKEGGRPAVRLQGR